VGLVGGDGGVVVVTGVVLSPGQPLTKPRPSVSAQIEDEPSGLC
jgi:hypothetical protein